LAEEVAVRDPEHAWSVLIALHALAASLALVVGPVNVLRRPRGDRAHRVVGRVWLVLMYFTAGSSYWIQQLRPGSFSWIHALSTFTLVTLTLGLWNARRGRIRAHAGNMIGTYLGLVGALIGVVAVPTRLVPQAFQTNWLAMMGLTVGVVAVGLAVVALIVRGLGRDQDGRSGHPARRADSAARTAAAP
jgi:uncharacterized membrane protein